MCVVSSLCTPRSTALIPVLTTTTLRERRRWVLEYLRLCASRLLQSLPRGMQACLLWKVTRALKLQVCCGVLQCVAVCFSGRAVSCSVLECVAVCCSVLQCVAVYIAHCSVLLGCSRQENSYLQRVVVCQCVAVQYVAVRCSVLQCAAVYCSVYCTLQCVAWLQSTREFLSAACCSVSVCCSAMCCSALS